MWKKWGPVICYAVTTAVLLFGMGFMLFEIKGATLDSLNTVSERLDVIQSRLDAIGDASTNISLGIGRIESGLDAYEVGYLASLAGFGESLDAIMASYERGLDERIEEIKRRE